MLNFGPLWKGISVGSDALKGPFIFYEVGGGWWDLRGAMQKIWLQRGGQPKKYGVLRGGHQKIAFTFSSDSICNNANINARRPKIAFLRF